MRPITVTVGPLAAASATAVASAQTAPTALSQLALNSTPTSGSSVAGFVGTGSISGNVLTVTATTSGAAAIGQVLSGLGVIYPVTIIGVGSVANTYVLSASQTLASTTIYGNQVTTLDTPRRMLVTASGADGGKIVTIIGTDWNNSVITENVTVVSSSTAQSNLDFKTVTNVYVSAATTGTISIGTSGVASSAWVRLDEYTTFPTAIQVSVTGAVNFTLQQTLQDPSSPTNPVQPYIISWINSADTNMVGATVSTQSSYTYAPALCKVTLNSGTGSCSMIVTQGATPSY